MDYEKLYKEAEQRAIKASLDGFLDAVPVKEIFPELAESEDERIRKAIIYHIQHCDDTIDEQTEKRMIAWLEKQNKQILANSAKTCKDEQKHSNLESIGEDWSEDDRTMAFTLMRDVDQMSYISKEGKNERIGWLNSLDEKFASREFTWSEEDVIIIGNIRHIISEYDKITKKANEPCWYIGDCLLWLQHIELKRLPQSKQEWSEEDKKKLNRIYRLIAEAADEHAFFTTCRLIGDKECVELQDFLKSLKPQPKQEWSKEDERIHQCLIRDQEKALDDVRNDKYGHSEIISDLKEMYRERLNWLESLKQRLKGE